MYKYLIFDADHTLIDFYADERAAFRRTFSHYGVAYTAEDVEKARVLSDRVWAEEGLNNVHLESVQSAFHSKYFSHLPRLIDRIKEITPMSAPSEEIAAYFVKELYVPSFVIGNALETFKNFSKKYKTCIATNGITDMQRARLKEFLPYTYKLFVSEELGTIKPNAAFFTGMLARLEAQKEECLFIGDSLSSDIAGCNAVGMDCIWVNPHGLPLPQGAKVKAVVSAVEEVENFLFGEK
ncbi:MAG: HAD family hydrolase [Clostridia bacterium]|nr:HAD family hydrolase [Clostridia bacterium]